MVHLVEHGVYTQRIVGLIPETIRTYNECMTVSHFDMYCPTTPANRLIFFQQDF